MFIQLPYSEPPAVPVYAEFIHQAGVELLMRREDRNHPTVSGNKWWKLLHNLEEARSQGFGRLLTFGGAYSNHIFSTAAAAAALGLESVGIIRGERTTPLNDTLRFASSQGMVLEWISREQYRKKEEKSFIDGLRVQFGDFYMIPEGGTNMSALKGAATLGNNLLAYDFDCLCVPVGTGGTIAGMITAFAGSREIIGFSALKGAAFLEENIQAMVQQYSGAYYENWRMEHGYHEGGYAKTTHELDKFIEDFKKDHCIPLEKIYTGKMMMGIFDMIRKGAFKKGTRILALHTGGLQTDF